MTHGAKHCLLKYFIQCLHFPCDSFKGISGIIPFYEKQCERLPGRMLSQPSSRLAHHRVA